MRAYKIVVSKKTYSKTNVGDFVKVGKDNSGVRCIVKCLVRSVTQLIMNGQCGQGQDFIIDGGSK